MRLKNLTPHPIVLVGREITGPAEWTETETTVPPSGTVARVGSIPGEVAERVAHGVPVMTAPTWGEVEGLPAPEPGVLLIVSGLVAGRCVGRADVVSPGTGPADEPIRNSDGQIFAVTRLIQAPQA